MNNLIKDDGRIRIPIALLDDGERRELDREFLRTVYERVSENREPVVRWRHRATDGLTEAFNQLRFQAGHSTGSEAACLDYLRQIAAIATHNARAMQILVNERKKLHA